MIIRSRKSKKDRQYNGKNASFFIQTLLSSTDMLSNEDGHLNYICAIFTVRNV